MENINDFAEWTTSKWYQSHDGVTEKDLSIMMLGLAGESGEVTEIIKKKLRDGVFDIEHFKSEMGDVIYYWSRMCKAFNVLPSEILEMNMQKLSTPRTKMTKLQLTDAIANNLQSFMTMGRMDSVVAEENPFEDGSQARAEAEKLIRMVLNSGVKK